MGIAALFVQDPWSSFVLGTDGLSARYCELNHLGAWLRQPMNSLSNLAYVLAGVWLWRREAAPGRSRSVFTLAACLCAVGVGSGLFHASIALFAQQLDMAGAYAVLLAGIAAPFILSEEAPKQTVRLALLAVVIALFYAFDLYLQGTWLLPLLVLLAGVTAAGVRLRAPERYAGPWLSRALYAAALGAAAWGLDDRKVLCAPRSLLQWHALWHVATASAAFCLYTFHLRGAARPSGAAAA